MRALEYLAWTLLIVALVVAGAYASLPSWIGAVASAALDGTGMRLVDLDADRPRLRGWRVHHARLAGDGLDVAIDAAAIEYRLGALIDGRLEAVSAARVSVAVGASAEADDAREGVPAQIPDLWALIPAERVSVARLEVTNAEPAARLDGSLEFDPASARASLHVVSPLLPAPIDATVAIEPAGGLALTVAEVGAAAPLATLSGVPRDGRIDIEGTLALDGEPFALAAGLLDFGTARGTVAGSIKGSSVWPFDATRLAESVFDAELDVDVADALADLENGRVAGAVTLALHEGRVTIAAPALRVAFTAATLDGVRYTVAPDTAVPLAVELAIRLDADDPVAALEGRVDARVALDFESVDPEAIAPWGSLNGSLQVVPGPTDLGVTLASGLTFDFGLPDIDEIGLELLEDAALAVDPETLDVRAARLDLALRVPELELDPDRLAFRDARLLLTDLRLDGDRLRSDVRLAARADERALAVAGALDTDLAAGTGKFRLTVDGDVAQPLFATELPGWRSVWDLDGGRLQATLEGTFRDTPEVIEVAAEGRVALEGGAAHYEEILLTGLSFDTPVTITPNGFTAGPGRVRIAALDPGVALTDADFVLQADDRTVAITGLDARLLGGLVTIEELAYDIEGESADFVVLLRQIDLAEVFALEGEDITGHGVIDGTLPVSTDLDGTRIASGRLAARPPGGHIEYRGALTGEGIPGLDLAMSALRNFDYKVLTADADYDANGTLKLAVRLQGASPNVEKGRAIHFNVNVTEDIPALLKSLRASDAVTEGVQRRFSR